MEGRSPSLMWDMVIREIVLLVAEEVKAHRQGTDTDTKDIPHAAAPVLKSPIPKSSDVTKKIECPDLDRSTSIPIFLDPQNFLPTLPPTPPPTLIAHYPASTEPSLRLPGSAVFPHEEDSDSDMEVDVGWTMQGRHSPFPRNLLSPQSPPPAQHQDCHQRRTQH
ncbi:hypothetical protein B0H14DRAFT_149660 [Mycena olivaceomarginata]|nr:hypothetical protein B0H14DRAFT_149660 [Mycena olivaceomarginata]